MIIWINGAFGAGKTTSAYELNRRLPNSFVFDPENFGYYFRRNTPKQIHKQDFQDHELWRETNYQILKNIHIEYSGTIIVPMTIINPIYYHEIIQRLIDDGIDVRHIILYASRETLLKRLSKRLSQGETWAKNRINTCLECFDNYITETKIMTDNLSVDEVINEISRICELELIEDKRSTIRKEVDRLVTLIKHIRN